VVSWELGALKHHYIQFRRMYFKQAGYSGAGWTAADNRNVAIHRGLLPDELPLEFSYLVPRTNAAPHGDWKESGSSEDSLYGRGTYARMTYRLQLEVVMIVIIRWVLGFSLGRKARFSKFWVYRF